MSADMTWQPDFCCCKPLGPMLTYTFIKILRGGGRLLGYLLLLLEYLVPIIERHSSLWSLENSSSAFLCLVFWHLTKMIINFTSTVLNKYIMWAEPIPGYSLTAISLFPSLIVLAYTFTYILIFYWYVYNVFYCFAYICVLQYQWKYLFYRSGKWHDFIKYL